MVRDLKNLESSKFGDKGDKVRSGRYDRGGVRIFSTCGTIVFSLSFILLLSLFVWGAPRLKERIFETRYFKLSGVDVIGVVRADCDEVAEAIGVRAGESVLETDLGAIRERVEDVGWVKDVEVIRELPSKLIVRIEEHDPVGVIMAKDGPLFVDMDGEIAKIDIDTVGYPRFGGMSSSEEITGGSGLLGLLLTNGIIHLDSIKTLEYDEVMGYTVHSRKDVELRFGYPPFEGKVKRLALILSDVMARGPIEYIYLDIEDRIIVKNRIN